MTSKYCLRPLILGLLLPVGQPALAAPPEPLVVDRLADPDPNYVPPKPEPKKAKRSAHQADESSDLDQAMANLGMVIGQAAQMERRREGASEEQIRAESRDAIQQLEEKARSARPD